MRRLPQTYLQSSKCLLSLRPAVRKQANLRTFGLSFGGFGRFNWTYVECSAMSYFSFTLSRSCCLKKTFKILYPTDLLRVACFPKCTQQGTKTDLLFCFNSIRN